MRGGRLAIGAVFVAVAACSALSEFDDLASTEQDAGADSGSIATDGGGTSDTSVAADAPAADSTTAPDTSTILDAGPDGPFCQLSAPDATFCDDFERDNPVFGWKSSLVSPGVTLEISDARAVSPTRSLHVNIPVDSGGAGNGELVRKFDMLATRVRLESDLYFDVLPTDTDAILLQITVSDAAKVRTAYRIQVNGGVMAFQEAAYPSDGGNATYLNHVLSRGLHPNEWEHIVMDLDFSTSPAKGSLAFGQDQVLPPDTITSMVTASFELFAPFYYVNTPSSAWSVYMDNLVVHVTP